MAPSSTDLLERAARRGVDLRPPNLVRDSAVVDELRRLAGVQKAAVPASTALDFGDTRDGAESVLQSVRHYTLLDAALPFAVQLSDDTYRVQVASGATGGDIGEGQPKAVTQVLLEPEALVSKKAVALCAVSNESLKSNSPAAERVVRRELDNAVKGALNTAFLSALTLTQTPGIGDPVADLATGLDAADETDGGYVIAASPAATRLLALEAEGRMNAVSGGVYVPGVVVVPAEVDYMIVIPAGRLTIIDHGLQLNVSEQADILLADNPSMPGQLTSLFQTNTTAFLVEREFKIYSASPAIEITLESI